MIVGSIKRFWRDSRANIAIIFALALIPLVFLVGMGIDYTSAADRQVQLNAAADAAVLAGVTPAMMAQPQSASITATTKTFTAQANLITGVSYSPTNVTVTATIVNAKRQVQLTYSAASQNAFPNILGQQSIALNDSPHTRARVALPASTLAKPKVRLPGPGNRGWPGHARLGVDASSTRAPFRSWD